ARHALVVAVDYDPWRIGGVRALEHRLLVAGELVPLLLRQRVDRAELPSAEDVGLAGAEPALLDGLVDREPELDDANAVVDEHALDLRRLLHEALVLLGGAEAHDGLDHGAVVPAAVEEDDLARVRQVLEVALEVPLPLLRLGR